MGSPQFEIAIFGAMQRLFIFFGIILTLSSCLDKEKGKKHDPKGPWRGRIMVDRESSGKELPFIFEVREKDDSLKVYFIKNGSEITNY